MRPQFTTVGPLAAASATNIRTASAIAGAGAVTLNGSLVSGGVATLDTPRRVLFTFAGNETGKTFTLLGTNWSDQIVGEDIAGTTAGTVASVLDYKTLTSVVSSAASVGNVSIGTNGVAASPWLQLDYYGPSYISIQANVTGTVNYTLQQTLDDPSSIINPVSFEDVVWLSTSDTAGVGATTSIQSNYLFIPVWVRVLLNSGTGSVTATYIQSGM
jgi:hypothetical protein